MPFIEAAVNINSFSLLIFLNVYLFAIIQFIFLAAYPFASLPF